MYLALISGRRPHHGLSAEDIPSKKKEAEEEKSMAKMDVK